MLLADDSIPETPYERFCKAEDLLTRQLIDSQDKYPYHAAAELTYFKRYFHKLTTQELAKIKKFINLIERCEEKLPNDVKEEIFFDMKRIIEVKTYLEKLTLIDE